MHGRGERAEAGCGENDGEAEGDLDGEARMQAGQGLAVGVERRGEGEAVDRSQRQQGGEQANLQQSDMAIGGAEQARQAADEDHRLLESGGDNGGDGKGAEQRKPLRHLRRGRGYRQGAPERQQRAEPERHGRDMHGDCGDQRRIADRLGMAEQRLHGDRYCAEQGAGDQPRAVGTVAGQQDREDQRDQAGEEDVAEPGVKGHDRQGGGDVREAEAAGEGAGLQQQPGGAGGQRHGQARADDAGKRECRHQRAKDERAGDGHHASDMQRPGGRQGELGRVHVETYCTVKVKRPSVLWVSIEVACQITV